MRGGLQYTVIKGKNPWREKGLGMIFYTGEPEGEAGKRRASAVATTDEGAAESIRCFACCGWLL